jgi:hypothetical protein
MQVILLEDLEATYQILLPLNAMRTTLYSAFKQPKGRVGAPGVRMLMYADVCRRMLTYGTAPSSSQRAESVHQVYEPFSYSWYKSTDTDS